MLSPKLQGNPRIREGGRPATAGLSNAELLSELCQGGYKHPVEQQRQVTKILLVLNRGFVRFLLGLLATKRLLNPLESKLAESDPTNF